MTKRDALLGVAHIFVHPSFNDALSRANAALRWRQWSRRLKSCGSDTRVGKGFSLEHPECISIGNDFHAAEGLMLQAWPMFEGKPTGRSPRLRIGDNVHIAERCQISCLDEVVIGDGCLLGGNVFITDNSHGRSTYDDMLVPPEQRELCSKGPVHIGRNVWLGRNVCVMPGVTIGDGVVVGANAVVTHDLPAFSVCVGAPARVIRTEGPATA